MQQFDVLVIGGGPGGYTAAIAAAKAGKKTALFEREKVGGTCLNVGCVPTKYLVDKASVLERIRALTTQEILRDPGSFSFRKIQSGKQEVVKKLTDGVAFLLKKNGVETIFGEAALGKNKTVTCGNEQYKGKNIIIATGAAPVRIPIPGAELCIDSTDALSLTELPKSMLVIGGGVIGLELASAFAAFGTKVTVVEMLPALLPNVQQEAAELVRKGLTSRGIAVVTGAKVLEVKKTGDGRLATVYETAKGQQETIAQTVLMAPGRKARLSGIDAEALGLEVSGRGTLVTDRNMETNVKGIYAVGDAAGGPQLAHAAFAEAETAVKHIVSGQETASGPIPACIYTAPACAGVGLTSKQAQEEGYTPVVGRFSYSANGMALAEGAVGEVFAVMDKKSGKTLGMHVVGENAAEMIGLATAAVTKQLTKDEWKDMVIAHPSLCEMLREAALGAFGEAIHKA